MIDHLQRLGIDYHFSEEIESFISSEYNNLHCGNNGGNGSSIYDVSLTFRLLREHGYYVSSGGRWTLLLLISITSLKIMNSY